MKSVLITGANRGVGLELARLCLEGGYRVFAGCRNPQRSAALDRLVTQYPGLLTLLTLDVTDPEGLKTSAQLIGKQVQSLHILFNNAAIHSEGEHISTFQADRALEMLNVNAVAPMLVAQYFLPLLKASPGARIINISSEAGSISAMNHFRGYYYFASKAALNMLTRSLAWDPETEGITVVALHPGWVRTDMGGAEAPTLPEESAAGCLQVAENLQPGDNGSFLTWDGRGYSW